MTLIAEDEKPGIGHAHKAGRIRAVMTVYRFAAARIDADELIDERRIARQRISEKILADSQFHSDDLSGIREKRGRLDPHVVSGERGYGKNESDNKTNDLHKSLLIRTYWKLEIGDF